MWGCLFCKREQTLFKISLTYGQTSNPIKDYIIEFLGPCEQYLHDDHGVCSACVYVLNNLLYIRKCMSLIVAATNKDVFNSTPSIKFSSVYKEILVKLQSVHYEECQPDNEERSEGDINDIDRQEVENIEDENQLESNEINIDPPNDVTRYKCINPCFSEFSSLEELTKHKVDHHGMFPNYVCCQCYEQKYYETKFVSPEDLKLHNDELHRFKTSCYECSEEVETLDELHKHVREHKLHCYPCNFCDLFFWNIKVCKIHMNEAHKDMQDLHSVRNYDEDEESAYNLELMRILHNNSGSGHGRFGYGRNARTPGGSSTVSSNASSRKRRKRRGYRWSRPKGWRSRSRMSTYSEPLVVTARRYSVMRNLSEYYDSGRSDSDDDNDREVARNMRFHRNGLLHHTRALSSRGTDVTYGTHVEEIFPYVYRCDKNTCQEEFDNLNELTEHKVEAHGMLANYVCYECCRTKFVSPEDLKLHNDQSHHTLISHCFLCSLELRTMDELQVHLKQHKSRSFRCNYCDLFFLSRKACREHMREAHKGKRKRVNRFKQCTILDRIQRSSSRSPVRSSETDDKYNGQILWRLQKKQRVKSLVSLCLEVINALNVGRTDMPNLLEETATNQDDNEENEEGAPDDSENQTMIVMLDSLINDIECLNENHNDMEISSTDSLEGALVPVDGPTEANEEGSPPNEILDEVSDGQVFVLLLNSDDETDEYILASNDDFEALVPTEKPLEDVHVELDLNTVEDEASQLVADEVQIESEVLCNGPPDGETSKNEGDL